MLLSFRPCQYLDVKEFALAIALQNCCCVLIVCSWLKHRHLCPNRAEADRRCAVRCSASSLWMRSPGRLIWMDQAQSCSSTLAPKSDCRAARSITTAATPPTLPIRLTLKRQRCWRRTWPPQVPRPKRPGLNSLISFAASSQTAIRPWQS